MRRAQRDRRLLTKHDESKGGAEPLRGFVAQSRAPLGHETGIVRLGDRHGGRQPGEAPTSQSRMRHHAELRDAEAR